MQLSTSSNTSVPPVSGVGGSCSAIEFARLVWSVGAAARLAGLVVPGFRDEPTTAVRHLRHRQGHVPVVVVAVRGRPFTDVHDDVVAGVLAANRDSAADAVETFIAAIRQPPSRPPQIHAAA